MGRTARAEALPWLKDPYDLEDESFRELWAAPLAAQLAGSVRSFAVVAAVTVAAVHLPARLAARAGVLPLRFQLVRVLVALCAGLVGRSARGARSWGEVGEASCGRKALICASAHLYVSHVSFIRFLSSLEKLSRVGELRLAKRGLIKKLLQFHMGAYDQAATVGCT